MDRMREPDLDPEWRGDDEAEAAADELTEQLQEWDREPKSAVPCSNPWCRGTANACGRTPQEHLEDGLSAEQFFRDNPPAEEPAPAEHTVGGVRPPKSVAPDAYTQTAVYLGERRDV